MQANDMLEILSNWHRAGTIRAVDLAIAKFLHGRDPFGDGRILLAGALASYQYGMGIPASTLRSYWIHLQVFWKPGRKMSCLKTVRYRNPHPHP